MELFLGAASSGTKEAEHLIAKSSKLPIPLSRAVRFWLRHHRLPKRNESWTSEHGSHAAHFHICLRPRPAAEVPLPLPARGHTASRGRRPAAAPAHLACIGFTSSPLTGPRGEGRPDGRAGDASCGAFDTCARSPACTTALPS